jgi:peptide/nickel transport system substrate-binding protein
MEPMVNDPARESARQDETALAPRLDRLTRRRVLGLLGAGTATAALAACGGAGPAATSAPAATTAAPQPTAAAGVTTAAAQPTSAAQASGKRGGVFNGAWPYELPPTGHFNQFVTKAIGLGAYRDLIDSAPTFYRWSDNRYIPILAEKWGYEGSENYTLTIKPGLKWSDGTPLTSKDVVATFISRRLYNGQLFQYVDRVEARDERTTVFHMKAPSTVVERYVLREWIVPHAQYGQFTDQAAALYAQGKDKDAEEIKKIRGDFDQYRPDRWLASGPYMLDPRSMNEASCELVRNPNGVNADVARFDRIKLYNGETPVVTPLIIGKEIDYATHGLAVATNRQMQAQGIRILRSTTHGGQAVSINFANPKLKILTDKRVRQAFAHAVKREDSAAVAYAESGKSPKYMAGVQDGLLEKWVSKDDLAKFNQYPYNLQRATELMQAAGCRKQGDRWFDPEGRPMEYELIAEAEFQDRSAVGQDWADQMTKFGVKITVRAVTFTQTPVEKREGRFELAMDPWGTGNPHPHFSFVATLLNKVQPLANGPYTSFDLKQQTDVVGAVDFQQLITESAIGLDVEKQKVNIARAALAYNELLPVLPVVERLMNGPALEGVRVVGWPADGNPIYENSPYIDNYVAMMIFDGTLGPK